MCINVYHVNEYNTCILIICKLTHSHLYLACIVHLDESVSSPLSSMISVWVSIMGMCIQYNYRMFPTTLDINFHIDNTVRRPYCIIYDFHMINMVGSEATFTGQLIIITHLAGLAKIETAGSSLESTT